MNKADKKLLTMLTYKRKEGSVGQKLFNERFLQPMMGKSDKFGNYICEVLPDGKINYDVVNPRTGIAFMAHHDTVHKTDGVQKVIYDPVKQYAYVEHDECLGADCTTGVWLILEMIRNKVPGVYIVHSGEECGGIGSGALVKSYPKWLLAIDFAISFDRMGTDSIITHQMGMRCCSESFVSDLESILNLNLKSDSGGVYTDSYEYADDVSECTNISVGYYNQHSKHEYQDVGFAIRLRNRLITADWSKLKPYRDPSITEWDDWKQSRSGGGWTSQNYISSYDRGYYNNTTVSQRDIDTLCEKYRNVESIVQNYPYEVAEILMEQGYTKEGLIREILTQHEW